MYREAFEKKQVAKYVEEIIQGNKKVVYWGVGFWGTKFGYEALKKRGIVPAYYCDNNTALWGKEVIDGIYCMDYKCLKHEKDTTVCVITSAMYHMQSIIDQLMEMGIEHILPYDRLVEYLNIEKEYFDFISSERIAVYTCIVGGYDDYIQPSDIPSNYDYYLISDIKPELRNGVNWIDIETVLPDYELDNTRKNRYCKINAHKIFPEYRRSVYIDGNMALKQPVDSFFEQLKNTRIGVGVKNNWKNIYLEAMSMIEQKRDDKKKIYDQIKKYWNEGMPDDAGGAICNFLIREHNNPVCRRIMESWWKEVESQSKRDQLSFPYVLWKNGYSINDVLVVADSSENDIWHFVDEHNVKRLQSC